MKPTVARSVWAYEKVALGWLGPFAAIITSTHDTSITFTVFHPGNTPTPEWALLQPVDPRELPGDSEVQIGSWRWAWPTREEQEREQPKRLARTEYAPESAQRGTMRLWLFIGDKPILHENIEQGWTLEKINELVKLINSAHA